MSDSLNARIDAWIGANRERIIGLARDLVRIPSENNAVTGAEEQAQRYLAVYCLRHGLKAELYMIADVPGMNGHPLRRGDVLLDGRPNVAVRLGGCDVAGGRSLVFTGHMDTVPAGSGAWTRDPFGGEIDGDRLYGRGSYDMKGGVAAAFMAGLLLHELGIRLRGSLVVESVADEEFAGGHGTIAGRLAGYTGEAVIVPEPSNLAIYRAHRGLRVARLRLRGRGGVAFSGERPEPAVHHLPALIRELVAFGQRRAARPAPPGAYEGCSNVANFMITKVRANDWRDDALLAVPDCAEVEFFWETLPGETREQVEAEFEEWLDAFRRSAGVAVEMEYRLRWMEGFETPAAHPFVQCAERQAAAVLGKAVPATGAPFPCDLFLFRRFGDCAGLVFGPAGANAHAPDEWVSVDSVVATVRMLARTACDWCGTVE